MPVGLLNQFFVGSLAFPQVEVRGSRSHLQGAVSWAECLRVLRCRRSSGNVGL
jgi:hypothetical protein